MSGMSQFMCQREDICHTVVPGKQDKGIFSIGAGTESAGGFSRVLGEVNPTVSVSGLHHFRIILTQNGKTFYDIVF